MSDCTPTFIKRVKSSLYLLHPNLDLQNLYTSQSHFIYVEYKDSSPTLFVYKYHLPLNNIDAYQQANDQFEFHEKPTTIDEMQEYSESPFKLVHILKNIPLYLEPENSESTEPRSLNRQKSQKSLSDTPAEDIHIVSHHPRSHYFLLTRKASRNVVQIWDYKPYLSGKESYKLVIEQNFVKNVKHLSWVDSKTAIVINGAGHIFFWFMKKNSIPTLLGSVDKSFMNSNYLISDVRVNSAKTTLLLTFRNKEREGYTQILKLDDSSSNSTLHGHAGCFADFRIKSQKSVPVSIISHKSTDNRITVSLIPQSTQGFIKKAKLTVRIQEKSRDYPVKVVPSEYYGLCFIITRFGYFSLVDIQSGIHVFTQRFTKDRISDVIPISNGFVSISTEGNNLVVAIDPATILRYVALNTQRIMPGFEDTLATRTQYKPEKIQVQEKALERVKRLQKSKSMAVLNLVDKEKSDDDDFESSRVSEEALKLLEEYQKKQQEFLEKILLQQDGRKSSRSLASSEDDDDKSSQELNFENAFDRGVDGPNNSSNKNTTENSLQAYDLPLPTIEDSTEIDMINEAKRKIEEERKKLEEDKKQQELLALQQQGVARRLEEMKKAHDEVRRAEESKLEQEEELKLQQEKMKLDLEMQRIEEEKRKIEELRKQHEEEKRLLEEMRRKQEEDQMLLEKKIRERQEEIELERNLKIEELRKSESDSNEEPLSNRRDSIQKREIFIVKETEHRAEMERDLKSNNIQIETPTQPTRPKSSDVGMSTFEEMEAKQNSHISPKRFLLKSSNSTSQLLHDKFSLKRQNSNELLLPDPIRSHPRSLSSNSQPSSTSSLCSTNSTNSSGSHSKSPNQGADSNPPIALEEPSFNVYVSRVKSISEQIRARKVLPLHLPPLSRAELK